MYGVNNLKPVIKLTGAWVECPVKECRNRVKKMTRQGPNLNSNKIKLKDYFCSTHKIYVSPSTFEYSSCRKNMIWKDPSDLKLFKEIKKVKRENRRCARDNSEDMVTWNVFRFLEKHTLLGSYLSELTNRKISEPELIYWSYYSKKKNVWSKLKEAREKFGEQENRSSEPDLIVKSDNGLFFIEAKLVAENKTQPSDKDNPKKYKTGGNNWFSEVFISTYEQVAIEEKKYELLRFWLLGSWIAKNNDLDFYLINLVREKSEKLIEAEFGKHVKQNTYRIFKRETWENIYQHIINKAPSSKDKSLMIDYFADKSIGYKKGKLQEAFSI